jgi:hypothetical protein
MTDKFSKRVGLVAGQDTWTTDQWAKGMLNLQLRMEIAKQNHFRYQRSQISDAQSERTIQTLEMALRFLAATDDNLIDWVEALPELMALSNSSKSSATGISPDECIYGFKTKQALETTPHQTLPIRQ